MGLDSHSERLISLYLVPGELYVEDLGERRIVSIRMGWLWVEGTPMRLPLRALNLRQAAPSLCQPHALALGFTLSNSQDHTLATFWVKFNLFPAGWIGEKYGERGIFGMDVTRRKKRRMSEEEGKAWIERR